jgi:hypothetical protein
MQCISSSKRESDCVLLAAAFGFRECGIEEASVPQQRESKSTARTPMIQRYPHPLACCPHSETADARWVRMG